MIAFLLSGIICTVSGLNSVNLSIAPVLGKPYDNSLVVYCNFDETSGVLAQGRFGIDGIVFASNWVKGRYGNAISLNGVDDYVNIANSTGTSFSSSFTIELWARIDSH